MKGFILAAGLGTRLRPLNLDVPKVMVPMGGKPLLEHHLSLFREQGIKDICINLHYQPESIRNYFQEGSKFGVRLNYSDEPKLLGTAGAVKKMQDWIGNETCLVFYGDNLTQIDFQPLQKLHLKHQSAITLVTYPSAEPWTGGVVETDSNGRVLSWIEKPPRENCKSNLISSGIFLMEPEILEVISKNTFSDFGKNVFPEVLRQQLPFYAFQLKAYIQDIGTPERYAKAEKDFQDGLKF